MTVWGVWGGYILNFGGDAKINNYFRLQLLYRLCSREAVTQLIIYFYGVVSRGYPPSPAAVIFLNVYAYLACGGITLRVYPPTPFSRRTAV